MAERQLHLNVNMLNAGFYGSAWRAAASEPDAFLTAAHYVKTARIAERGTFDAVFLADVPALSDRPEYRPFHALEPTLLLTAVAAATENIGLIATASTTYNEPYNIARRFATLDLVSGGRSGWNVVTTADAAASRNFGFDNVTAHATRYERAAEFTEVVTALWDSWEDDALVGDKASGQFLDLSKVHSIQHSGRHFSVKGPLNLPRSPQGHPVVVQAGGSEDGRELAARHAEAIFSVALTIEEGVSFSADIRRRAARYGRRPEAIVTLPGLATVIGSTDEEARRREDRLWSLIPGDYSLVRVAGIFKVDPANLDLDRPLPDAIELPVDGSQTFFRAMYDTARRDGLTVRQLLRKLGGGTGHRVIVGSPVEVADDIEAWFHAGAADGFNLMPDVLPDGLEIFVDEVVPILRKRGIFRHAYEGSTLRDHLGLAMPVNRNGARRIAS
ncbi:LLM class flavin-dependent oxidoreductase [Chenggangzhangella methanolivorans]|uniref:LLM class flavin-dependent oxidoreductase n=1 Tax=Chenggangzhangella methanolivorans TaxID=1437009 RepID=A0A9E6RAB6_9HYPH|nr:LLM class flavin-dependent oxidoreductase [Chenggangzhangella methanolivorans]QZO00492.1 LLM class flavin-dependent oxidoreductase [Chenggangzhangella methanolivorans]